ncbi:MAG: ABC transporter permease [Alphaproteobacteria bacterium]|nr:ABC transporter permease [Alphaproteobacteria bacterium]
MIGLPLAWLGVFFLGPLLIALAVSFAEVVDGAPPFRLDAPGLTAWRLLAGDALYRDAFLSAIRIAATVTVLAALLAYPMAYAIARAPEARRPALLLLVMLPFWTSFLIRIYAWTALLRPTGLINEALIALGVVTEPLALIDNEFAVHLGLVYVYLPFMVLPLYATIEKLDPALEEAAADLGARPWATFRTVTLPLTWPGLAAGALLVFIPASAEFIVPELLGGAEVNLIGRALWTEFFGNRDWPAAAALAVALIAVLGGPILLFQRLESRS